MKDIVIHPATVCLWGMLFTTTATIFRYALGALLAPRQIDQQRTHEEFMKPTRLNLFLTVPIDLLAITLLVVGSYHLFRVGLILPGILFTGAALYIYVILPLLSKINYPFSLSEPEGNPFLSRRQGEQDKCYWKYITVLITPLFYQVYCWATLEQTRLTPIWTTTLFAALSITVLHPLISGYWEKKGYNIEGDRDLWDRAHISD